LSIAALSNISATVERKTLTRDAFGSSVEAWATSSTQNMAVQPLSGREIDDFSREEYTVSHRGYVSGTPDIVVGDRLDIDGDKFLIHAVLNTDSAGHHLKILMEQEI